MKSISILGCGWLGLPLGKHLALSGFEIKGSTTSGDKLSQLQAADIKPYLFKFNPVLEGQADDFFQSDILIVNLPPRNQNGNLTFHESQLKTIRRLAIGSIQKTIFISSTAVYPSSNQEVVESDANVECLSRGSVSLLEMEQLFSENAEFETTVLRFGGLHGPNRHPGRFLAGKKDLAGANNPVNMIHLEDCIGAIQAIIDQNIWGAVFNVCAPTKETRQSFYEKAAKELSIEAPTFSNDPTPFKKVISNKFIETTGYQFKN